MTELVQLIASKTHISPEEADKVLHVVASYIKEKYPLLAGTVDSVLGTQPVATGTQQ